MLPDSVVEIKPTYPTGGTVVWEWHVWDHLIQDYDATKANYGNVAAHPELIDADGTESRIPSFWNHMNSIDYNADARPDRAQRARQQRGLDHRPQHHDRRGRRPHRRQDAARAATCSTAGAIRSPTARARRATRSSTSSTTPSGSPAGYPGAGNITVFNNGLGRNYSTIDEFTPPVDADGNYALTAGAAFGPTTFTWTYKANPPAVPLRRGDLGRAAAAQRQHAD